MREATLTARSFADSAGIDEADRSRLAVLVEELVTNLYDHGGLGVEDVFDIELSSTGTDINLVVIDPGQPFDPRVAGDGDAIPSRGGGAGLKLVRAWASHIDYRTADGRNRLAVVLPLRRSSLAFQR